jgi:hypothetical protein
MGPKKTKQGLIPIGGFFPQASILTLNKHKKLVAKLRPKPPKKPKVDKIKQERLAREKAEIDGAESWKKFLQDSGVQHVQRFRTDLLFLAHGNAPEAHSEEAQHLTASDLDIESDEDDDYFAV